MSAIRGANRRTARSVHSSPYASARPASKKKSSSWTFGIGGLLSYINPLRLRRSADQVVEEASSDEDSENEDEDASNSPADADMGSPNDISPPLNPLTAQNPAASLAARGRQLASGLDDSPQSPVHNLPNIGILFSTPPRASPNSPPEDTKLSPAESLDKVQKFLREKNGQALSEWETRGLLTFLEKTGQNEDKPEPFRFSSTPSKTPVRGNSPAFVFGATPTVPVATSNGNGTTPRKTLAKNPNGVYRWQGGGSAKPRNRYQSPSFGIRSPAPTIKLSPAKTEGKRRRIGDESESSSSTHVPFPAVSPQKQPMAAGAALTPTPAPSQSRASIFPLANGAASSTSNTNTNGASSSSTPKTNGTSVPRLRTSGLPTKPTAPPIPSPLRQAWGQSDSPPHSPKPNGPTPTKAANFMTELIKEVTPAKRPDLSNPYQTASPVKPPVKKPVIKRPRPSAKPPSLAAPAPEPEKLPEPSPQAIIEATLPKGSKRSRPPADLAKSSRSEPISAPAFSPAPGLRNPRKALDLPPINESNNPFNFDRGSEEVTDDLPNPKKQRKSPAKESTITIEEIDDVDMSTSTSELAPALFLQPAEIIEPDNASSLSKADQSTTSSNGFFSSSSTPTSPTKSSSLFGMKSSAPKEPSKLRFSYQADKSETPLSPLSFSPIVASTSYVAPSAPKPSAATLPSAVPPVSQNVVPIDPKQTVIAMSIHDLPAYNFPSSTFAFSAAGFESAKFAAKSTASPSLPTYDFTTPQPGKLPAPVSALPTAPPVMAFNWSAAGVKAPVAAGASWTCSSCMLSNPASATDKCTICDAKR